MGCTSANGLCCTACTAFTAGMSPEEVAEIMSQPEALQLDDNWMMSMMLRPPPNARKQSLFDDEEDVEVGAAAEAAAAAVSSEQQQPDVEQPGRATRAGQEEEEEEDEEAEDPDDVTLWELAQVTVRDGQAALASGSLSNCMTGSCIEQDNQIQRCHALVQS